MNTITPGKYRHYKGKLYEVVGTATHSETLEEVVVYKALYVTGEREEGALWVRPKAMFEEKVIVNGEQRSRFEYIGS